MTNALSSCNITLLYLLTSQTTGIYFNCNVLILRCVVRSGRMAKLTVQQLIELDKALSAKIQSLRTDDGELPIPTMTIAVLEEAQVGICKATLGQTKQNPSETTIPLPGTLESLIPTTLDH